VLDRNELVTWLDDSVLFAPSMLLGPHVRWLGRGDHAFDVTLTDRGQSVAGRVYIDERGAPLSFATSDRVFGDKKRGLVRGVWTTPVRSWQRIGTRVLPARGDATWLLPGGDFTYARFAVAGVSAAA
jgi:hypothetical protein